MEKIRSVVLREQSDLHVQWEKVQSQTLETLHSKMLDVVRQEMHQLHEEHTKRLEDLVIQKIKMKLDDEGMTTKKELALVLESFSKKEKEINELRDGSTAMQNDCSSTKNVVQSELKATHLRMAQFEQAFLQQKKEQDEFDQKTNQKQKAAACQFLFFPKMPLLKRPGYRISPAFFSPILSVTPVVSVVSVFFSYIIRYARCFRCFCHDSTPIQLLDIIS
jgi:hypothetical protein